MTSGTYDINELKRRMQSAIGVLKQELGALRTGLVIIELVRADHRICGAMNQHRTKRR